MKPAGLVISHRWDVAIHWYFSRLLTTVLYFQLYVTLQFQVGLHDVLFCLVSAVQGAHRRVQDELEPSSAAVKILQDIFVELTKNTEREDETRMTEPVQSE